MNEAIPQPLPPLAEDPVARYKKKCLGCGDRHYKLDDLAKHGWLSDEELDLVGDVYARLKSTHDPSILNPETGKHKRFSCYLSKHLFKLHVLRDSS